MKIRSVAAAIALLTAPSLPWAGDLNSEVNRMFNNLGTIGNYTAPGAFRGQAFNTYTGGSLMLRSQNKTYQLMSIDYPTARAGCGGIDVFGGSFSHISSAELKNMLRNITSALPGVAFQLALDTVSPLLGSVTERFNNLSTMVNNARINSCETAKAMVSSTAEMVGFNAQESCADVAVALGLESDRDSARRRCGTDRPGVLNTARNSDNPEAKARAGFAGNITWHALQLVSPNLDNEERELVMSIIGTAVYEEPDKNPIVWSATLTSIPQLLYGQSDTPEGDIEIPMLRCDEYTKCLNVRVDEHYRHTPLTVKVANLMHSIAEKIINRQPIANNSREIGFVNQTSEPVYRLLSIATSRLGTGLDETLIAQYRDVIAADYAYVFLDRTFRMGMDALEKDYLLNSQQRQQVAWLRERAMRQAMALSEQKQTVYAKVNSINSMASALDTLDRQLRAGLPQQILDALGRRNAFMR